MNDYVVVQVAGRRVLKHVHIVEQALGRRLRGGEEVHHANQVKNDNRHGNLVACQDREYHMLLHTRQRAFDACGHPDWRRCVFCRVYSSPSLLVDNGTGGVAHHDCRKAYSRARWQLRHGDPTTNKSRASNALWASRSAADRTALANKIWATRRERGR